MIDNSEEEEETLVLYDKDGNPYPLTAEVDNKDEEYYTDSDINDHLNSKINNLNKNKKKKKKKRKYIDYTSDDQLDDILGDQQLSIEDNLKTKKKKKKIIDNIEDGGLLVSKIRSSKKTPIKVVNNLMRTLRGPERIIKSFIESYDSFLKFIKIPLIEYASTVAGFNDESLDTYIKTFPEEFMQDVIDKIDFEQGRIRNIYAQVARIMHLFLNPVITKKYGGLVKSTMENQFVKVKKEPINASLMLNDLIYHFNGLKKHVNNSNYNFKLIKDHMNNIFNAYINDLKEIKSTKKMMIGNKLIEDSLDDINDDFDFKSQREMYVDQCKVIYSKLRSKDNNSLKIGAKTKKDEDYEPLLGSKEKPINVEDEAILPLVNKLSLILEEIFQEQQILSVRKKIITQPEFYMNVALNETITSFTKSAHQRIMDVCDCKIKLKTLMFNKLYKDKFARFVARLINKAGLRKGSRKSRQRYFSKIEQDDIKEEIDIDLLEFKRLFCNPFDNDPLEIELRRYLGSDKNLQNRQYRRTWSRGEIESFLLERREISRPLKFEVDNNMNSTMNTCNTNDEFVDANEYIFK